MFVLTTTAKAVSNSDDPYIGFMLFVTLIIIIAVSAVLIVNDMHKR